MSSLAERASEPMIKSLGTIQVGACPIHEPDSDDIKIFFIYGVEKVHISSLMRTAMFFHYGERSPFRTLPLENYSLSFLGGGNHWYDWVDADT